MSGSSYLCNIINFIDLSYGLYSQMSTSNVRGLLCSSPQLYRLLSDCTEYSCTPSASAVSISWHGTDFVHLGVGDLKYLHFGPSPKCTEIWALAWLLLGWRLLESLQLSCCQREQFQSFNVRVCAFSPLSGVVQVCVEVVRMKRF